MKEENTILKRQITNMEELKNERVHIKQEKNETIEKTPNMIKNMKEEILEVERGENRYRKDT